MIAYQNLKLHELEELTNSQKAGLKREISQVNSKLFKINNSIARRNIEQVFMSKKRRYFQGWLKVKQLDKQFLLCLRKSISIHLWS
jgi:hypothetical protein